MDVLLLSSREDRLARIFADYGYAPCAIGVQDRQAWATFAVSGEIIRVETPTGGELTDVRVASELIVLAVQAGIRPSLPEAAGAGAMRRMR